MGDSFITLYDESFNALASDDDGGAGFNSLLHYTPGTTGTYFVGVSGFSNNTGTYKVLGYTFKDRKASTAAIGPLSIGAAQTGTISGSFDHDWFQINLVKGKHYNFSLTDSANTMDTFLTLRTGAGASIKSDDDSGPGLNSKIANFKATKTGKYYLDASAFSNGVGNYSIVASLV